jgi:hypothetical protein
LSGDCVRCADGPRLSGDVDLTQRQLIDALLVEYGTFVRQLPRNELSAGDGNQLSFCQRFPPLVCQGNAREQSNKLTVALDGEPIRHKASLAVLTMFLEQHETGGFHPAGVGLLAPNLVEAILGGRQLAEVTLAGLMRPFPVGWQEQSRILGT